MDKKIVADDTEVERRVIQVALRRLRDKGEKLATLDLSCGWLRMGRFCLSPTAATLA
jgi:hypothetical protein